jgi:transcriptional regulator with XRE-family HTH domain
MDLSNELRPFAVLMRQRRKDLKLTADRASKLAGKGFTWLTELETGKGIRNPQITRLVAWAQALDVQELGLYVVIDGHFTAVPVLENYDEDEDEDSA